MLDQNKILIIDDEPQIRRFLRISLEANGFNVIEAHNGKEGIKDAALYNPALIILDLELPDIYGSEVLKEIRSWNSVPIIVVSVRNSEEEKINLLDLGADDYVTKPFSTGELLARIRTAIRHKTNINIEPIVTNGNLIIDFGLQSIFFKNELLKLTSTEFSIMKLFFLNLGKVLTHKYILKEIWGNSYSEDTQYLRVFIAQIRKKIEIDPSKPQYITTESGVGYRMNVVNL